MNNVKRLWQDIRSGQNLEIYLNVLLSFGILALAYFGVVDQTTIMTALLATVALVSISLLNNRRENETIQRAISQLDDIGSSKKQLLQHPLTSYVTLNQHLLAATNAEFWGLTFERVLPHIRDTLAKRLQSGLEVRFLLLKPGSNAVKMAVFRDKHNDLEEVDLTLRKSLSILNALGRSVAPPAKLEIRVADYLPPWTLVAFDSSLPNGQIFVSLLPFRNTDEVRPSFVVSSTENSEWIRVFHEQFEALWHEAEPVKIK